MWSSDVLEHVRAATAPDFAQRLIARPPSEDAHQRWDAARLPVERGLEQWVGWLGLFGRTAFVAAAAAAARHAYPKVLERAGASAIELAIHADAPCADGASEGAKVALVEAWLAAPSNTSLAAVAAGVDPSRQMHVWYDDLRPADDSAWLWFMAVGDLTARAVVHAENGDLGDDPMRWPAAVCAARSVVCALRSIRREDGDVAADVTAQGRAIAAAFGLA